MVDKKKKKSYKDSQEGLGISGFTLGVLSIILAGSIGLITSIVGFIFCYSQQRKSPMKLGKVGIILNIIGFVVSIVFIVVLMIPSIADQINNFPGA
jgi:vacuolar-type H+-ATPase subunit I/STV1